MRVQPLIRGQQRGVDVEHATGIAVDEHRGENAHEAGQDDQVGRMAIDDLDQRSVIGLAVVVFLMGQHHGVDAGFLGAHQAVGVAAIGDHGNDLAAQLIVSLRIDQGLKVAAVA